MREQDRSREAAIVIPAFGLFLLLPPILSLFDTGTTVFGVPLLHIYVFLVWFALVLAGGWLAHRLRDQEPERGRPEAAVDVSDLAEDDEG